MYNCNCRPNCTFIAVLASIVIGIIAGFLTVSGILTLPTPFLWVGLAVSLISLGLLLILSVIPYQKITHCLCDTIRLILTGILGAILTSVILLVIDIATASVIGAIIVGLLFLFLSLIITTLACLLRCLTDCDD